MAFSSSSSGRCRPRARRRSSGAPRCPRRGRADEVRHAHLVRHRGRALGQRAALEPAPDVGGRRSPGVRVARCQKPEPVGARAVDGDDVVRAPGATDQDSWARVAAARARADRAAFSGCRGHVGAGQGERTDRVGPVVGVGSRDHSWLNVRQDAVKAAGTPMYGVVRRHGHEPGPLEHRPGVRRGDHLEVLDAPSSARGRARAATSDRWMPTRRQPSSVEAAPDAPHPAGADRGVTRRATRRRPPRTTTKWRWTPDPCGGVAPVKAAGPVVPARPRHVGTSREAGDGGGRRGDVRRPQ